MSNNTIEKEVSRCGMCKTEIGFGRNKTTGAEIRNFRVILNPEDPRFANLVGLPVKANVVICIRCAEQLATNLSNIEGRRQEFDSRDPVYIPTKLKVN